MLILSVKTTKLKRTKQDKWGIARSLLDWMISNQEDMPESFDEEEIPEIIDFLVSVSPTLTAGSARSISTLLPLTDTATATTTDWQQQTGQYLKVIIIIIRDIRYWPSPWIAGAL